MAVASRPKRNVHHKRRTGKHHKHSKPYLKTYWPYIPMLLIVGVGFIVNSLWANGNVLGDTSNLTSAYLLNETNQSRAQEKRVPLTLDDQLSSAAQAK